MCIPQGMHSDTELDLLGPIPTTELGGLPISRLGMEDTLSLLRRWAGELRPRRVATANVDFLRNASLQPGLRSALRSADMITADGFPLVALSRLLGEPIVERVAGSDLVPALAPGLARDGRSVFLLGGRPGVAEAAGQRLQAVAPGLRIAGTAAPFIDWSSEDQVRPLAQRIARTQADVLLVALGSPRQEHFLERWLGESGCRLGIGVGATLDFLAGQQKRAPKVLRSVGLEWAHRLLQEPRRLGGRYAADAAFLGSLVSRELQLAFSDVRTRAALDQNPLR